jgi:hypothetical protein
LVYYNEAAIESGKIVVNIKTKKMKTVFTLIMLVLVTVASIVSCKLFMRGHYDISALLTLTSIVSIILSVYVISDKKISLS